MATQTQSMTLTEHACSFYYLFLIYIFFFFLEFYPTQLRLVYLGVDFIFILGCNQVEFKERHIPKKKRKEKGLGAVGGYAVVARGDQNKTNGLQSSTPVASALYNANSSSSSALSWKHGLFIFALRFCCNRSSLSSARVFSSCAFFAAAPAAAAGSASP